jgi:hypothetical protein
VAFYPNQNTTAAVLVGFLRALRRHVRGPLILIWDRLATHRARSTKALLARWPQVHSVLLPPYAPELSAVEYVWAYFNGGPLASHAPDNADELARTAVRPARSVAGRQRLLRGFVRATGLLLRLGGARRGHSGTPPQ